MNRAAAVLLVLATLGVVGACAGNDGGETRCEEFALMSEGDRTAVVEQLLGGSPSAGTVDLTVSAATYHCLAPDSADDLVKDVLG
ncbi:hypothetical protein [Aeromicrobium sp. Sec7.5]|uniref:hypothetical protein n=1 Tax=Aeromicrobium sp. Sec7.5 TaxID=3121276 RepID=UPI002FE4E294